MIRRNRSTALHTGSSKLMRYYAPAVVIFLFVAFLIYVLGRDRCSSELLVAGDKLNFQAAFDKLKLGGAASPAAQEKITQQLQYYIESSARLCRQQKAGEISSKDYLKRIDVASTWYMNIQSQAASGKLKGVTSETAAALGVEPTVVSSAAPQSLATIAVTTSDGAILPPGATIHAGERISLTVTLPKPSFVYVLNLGSGGRLGRAFPESSESDLPASGTIRIPADPTKFLKVAGPSGVEKLLIFVSVTPDPELENISALASSGKYEAARATLQTTAVMRDLLKESEPPRHANAKPIPVELRSRFGKATLTVTLRNAG